MRVRLSDPVRAGQPREIGVPMLAVGLQGRQQRTLGVKPRGPRGRIAAQDPDVVDPECARAQELEPEPGQIEPPAGTSEARTTRGSHPVDTLSSVRLIYGCPPDSPSIQSRTLVSAAAARKKV